MSTGSNEGSKLDTKEVIEAAEEELLIESLIAVATVRKEREKKLRTTRNNAIKRSHNLIRMPRRNSKRDK